MLAYFLLRVFGLAVGVAVALAVFTAFAALLGATTVLVSLIALGYWLWATPEEDPL